MLQLPKHNNEELSIEKIREFIQWWDATYPIDFWWRQKYKVAFGSKEHKEQNILDMRIEFEEDRMLKLQEQRLLEKSKYQPGRGDWLNKRQETREISNKQAEDIFESIDISKLQQQDLEKQKAGEKTSNDIIITKE